MLPLRTPANSSIDSSIMIIITTNNPSAKLGVLFTSTDSIPAGVLAAALLLPPPRSRRLRPKTLEVVLSAFLVTTAVGDGVCDRKAGISAIPQKQ